MKIGIERVRSLVFSDLLSELRVCLQRRALSSNDQADVCEAGRSDREELKK